MRDEPHDTLLTERNGIKSLPTFYFETEIMAKVKEAEFHGLRNRYVTMGTDIATETIAITESKKTKKVSVRVLGLLEEDKEVKRFYRVWSEILRKLPAPNAEQKPELYER